MPIFFYKLAGSHGAFSNFSPHPVRVAGLLWPTSEHAFQALKFSHRPDLMNEIRVKPTPREAADRGRDRSLPLHRDWEKTPLHMHYRLPDHAELQVDDGIPHEEPLFTRTKDVVMYEVIYSKVMQHNDVRALLLSTREESIIEASPKDSYWAWGSTERGENKLGRIFMSVRRALVRGAETRTAFGKPDRVTFICTAGYPWQPEFGQASHPEAKSAGRRGHNEDWECPNCGAYYEVPV